MSTRGFNEQRLRRMHAMTGGNVEHRRPPGAVTLPPGRRRWRIQSAPIESWRKLASTLVAVLGLITAPGCGSRTDLTPDQVGPGVGASGGTGSTVSGGGGGAPVVPSLEVVEEPFSIFPADFVWSAVKVVARSGGVDVLANRDGVPFGVLARHAKVATTKPSITWSGPAVEILPGVVNGTIATANGDSLVVCHNQFVGDPSSLSAFSGTYDKTSGPSVLWGGTMCQGVAFRDGKGLLGIHKLPPTGCCSRPEVFDIDGKGNVLSQGPELALPEEEFGGVRVTAYSGGFAWAGPVGDATSAGMHVRFRRETDTLAYTIPLDAESDKPDIAAWPFDAAAAVSFPQGNGVRLIVVHESGNLLIDDAIMPPPGEEVLRAPLGTTPHGVVTAYARCADDFSPTPGELRLELRRPDESMLETSVPVTCPAFVSTLAVVGDAVVVVFSSEDGLQGVVVKIVP